MISSFNDKNLVDNCLLADIWLLYGSIQDISISKMVLIY